jgi:predicted esterase
MSTGRPITRREFCNGVVGIVAGSIIAGACRLEGEGADFGDGRIVSRPGDRVTTTAEGGSHALGLASGRDAILHLPPKTTRTNDAAMPLLVLLHGASGSGERVLEKLGSAADDAGVAVLAPDSRGTTWDAIRGGFGRDVSFLNTALAKVFERVAVDPSRLTLGGFSDGATYALSLGLINGDLFPRLVAFSPGFLIDGAAHGQPRIFVSHGTKDEILPIDRCSRRIVPDLQRRGRDVTFREFNGGHAMPADVVREAMQWVARK